MSKKIKLGSYPSYGDTCVSAEQDCSTIGTDSMILQVKERNIRLSNGNI